MVRVKEIKDKFSLNQSFRSWKASHTFGGTTKAKSLYIAGFRRHNFYYVAAITGAILLIGGIAGGVGVRKSVNGAENRGQVQGAMGQLVATNIIESRTRTLTSNGILVLTTEISSFATTVQRGGGTTLIQTTGAGGERITIPGAITFVTNSDDRIVEKTLVGSTFFVTQPGGITVPTTLYGAPITFTDTNGKDITSTAFSELTVVTEADGDISTSLRSQPSSTAAPITSGQTTPPTQTSGDTSTGTSSIAQSRTYEELPSKQLTKTDADDFTSTNTPTTSSNTASSLTTSSSSSSSSPSTSTASSGSTSQTSGGGGGLFRGEGTFYTPGLGSCGIDSTEAEFVAALSKVLFDATGVANSNNNPYCGRKALVKAAGAKRLHKRDAITRVGVAERVWYSGNFTLGGWGKSRGMKESRRSKVNSEMEWGQQREQKNLLNPRPSKEYISVPMTTPVYVVGRYDSNAVVLPPPPVITSPPMVHGAGLGKRQAGGGGVTITIVDRCPVCAQYDLDLSPAAFDVIGKQDEGRVAIEWSWLD